jgi:pimeloyl-ACP methyl ester carboxylesterase
MDNKIKLRDGRALTYAEYGDPRGKPVFLFHGMPGSRVFRPHDEITTKLGVRLITVDRPGYGLSTFQSNRQILDWPNDIAQLADQLGIDKFAVAGHSGGGPYAAACAFALTDRVTAAALICGAGPVDSSGALEHMDGLNRMGFRVGRHIPWLVWWLLIWAFYRDGNQRPEKIMEREAATRPRADAELWKIDSIREVCYASVVEAFRNGTKGHAWEARLMTRPWNLPVEKIQAPVHIWHGTSDRTTPIQMARYLAGRIPNCHTHFCEGEAHLLIFPHWQEILLELTQEHG